MFGAPLRPPCAVPPAPRPPVGFSNVTARLSSDGSMYAGLVRIHRVIVARVPGLAALGDPRPLVDDLGRHRHELELVRVHAPRLPRRVRPRVVEHPRMVERRRSRGDRHRDFVRGVGIVRFEAVDGRIVADVMVRAAPARGASRARSGGIRSRSMHRRGESTRRRRRTPGPLSSTPRLDATASRDHGAPA